MSNTSKEIEKFIGMFPPVTFANGDCHMIGSFGNVGIVETDEGLVVFDITTRQFRKRLFRAFRAITNKQIKYLVYSHGHFDHCFGFPPFLEEIKEKNWELPQIIAHAKLIERFKRYKELEEYQNWINSMQFASIYDRERRFTSTREFLEPTIIIKGNENYTFTLGNLTFEIYHDMGETDDSIWMFVPEKKVLFTGDLMISSFPNVGNPYKVQRYPKHWALAMEKMLEKNAEYLVPGHGPLIEGKERIKDVLSITAEVMHFVHDEVVKRLNEGKWFEQIYHEMLEIYPEKFKKHYILRPMYGSYQYAIHAVYRLYHGWYNTGNPTDLFPAKSTEIAKEFLKINSEGQYLEHAMKLYEEGKLQLALHILDVIIKGSDSDYSDNLINVYKLKLKILKKKAHQETSFISFNIFKNGANEIKDILENLSKRKV